MQIHVHNPTMVIYNQYKFHLIPPIGYLVMAEDGKKSMKTWQWNGNNSAIPDDSQQKTSRA